MFYQDWELALIAIIALPLVGFLSSRLGKRMKKAATGTQTETGILATLLSENLDGTRIVKAYQQEDAEIKKVLFKNCCHSFGFVNYQLLRICSAQHISFPLHKF